MSAFVPDVPAARHRRHLAGGRPGLPAVLTLTGERTIPDLDIENYWFRRHEVVYQRLAPRCAGRDVLEAGCGEGYGADLIAGVARRVVAVDYDEAAVAHVRSRYPRVEVMRANLAELPLPDASVDVVVNFQVIEHLWDQGQFVRECLRVLRPPGLLMVSTPNRITFSPGRDTPINPFHTRELNADELTELLVDAGFCAGVDQRVVPRAAAAGDGCPPRRLHHRRADRAGGGRRSVVAGADGGRRRRRPSPTSTWSTGDIRDIADSLDLIAIAVRP